MQSRGIGVIAQKSGSTLLAKRVFQYQNKNINFILKRTFITTRISYGNFHKGTPNPQNTVKKVKSKEEIAKERYEKQLNSPNRFIRWGAIARSDEFTKGMTKYLIIAYIVFLVYGISLMKKQYGKEKELENLEEKFKTGDINEYETLRIKELKGKLRTRDELKLKEYERLKTEEGIENLDGIVLPNNDQNKINKDILPPRDTTPFYESKAEQYDKDINFEEKVIRMGSKRKWLMKHCKGDVLEVSCGTGRNIPYLNIDNINSITFLDSSKAMIEITNKKYRQKFPTFNKVAFVQGKVENLTNITSDKEKVKYDTIVEAFGLCSHEDPVSALKNFSSLLKPHGRIVLLEHGRGRYNIINKILDKRSVKRLETWGCRWNLDIGEILDDSGLEIVEEKRVHWGTTWCIVAKQKGDIKKQDEIGFFEKYIGSSIKNKYENSKE
ncbi:methyltransferase Oms1p, mitochondrial [Monosporozyma servazzii]